jgi:hypothetical protein
MDQTRLINCPANHPSCGFLITGSEKIACSIDLSDIIAAGKGLFHLDDIVKAVEAGIYGGCSQCLLCHQALYVNGPDPLPCE